MRITDDPVGAARNSRPTDRAGQLASGLRRLGRSGVGKTSVAAEISRQLVDADIWHALIEGDYLGQAHPEPWRQGIPLVERNLAAMWRNYRDLGYHRLIYTNTASVLNMDSLTFALGGSVIRTGVLLTASDETTAERLARREVGSGLSYHLEASKRGAEQLAAKASDQIHRVATDSRSVATIASEVISLTTWLGAR